MCHLADAHDASLIMSFVWTPSHIWLAGNDTADRLAKAACMLDVNDVDAEQSLRCLRIIICSSWLAVNAAMVRRRDAEKANIVSIQYHDNFLHIRYKYGRHGLMVRKHNVVSAQLRLGYWPL
ncbi:hypothetical protein Pmani_013344 [Petrolisthes manimaculis]|uniref:RNase H type-1 domain-containing protein n=1 Tax=Petrolisthes manimaculis TaxID=1843537 RepID=A0AAE1PYQ8_9EUCA|nr:hypothetical protein Pmani_013344 [Petrolisthes manimaculis]